TQQRQKEYHDKRIKLEKFKIGEQVLVYKSAKEKIYGDKLRKK
ncbi:243_t:CDS:1, partial [Racocetra persica]